MSAQQSPVGASGSLAIASIVAAGFLAGCQNPAVTRIDFSADTNAENLGGEILFDQSQAEIRAGQASVAPAAPAQSVSVRLVFTDPQNKGVADLTRTAVITTQIEVSNSSGAPQAKAAHGTVTITGNKNQFPNLILNCDHLFQISAVPEKQGSALKVTFNGFKDLASCTPEKKVNLDLYNPLMIAHRDPSEGLAIRSMEEDMERGKAVVDELLALDTHHAIHDRSDDISQYVQQIAEKVVAASDLPNQKVTAYVVDEGDINAFALPGGYVFVYTGLLRSAGSEAELVGVLGHEWSHVTCRHSSRAKSEFRIILGKEKADQREEEYEADAIGTQYAWNAGYEPTALTGLFEKLADMEAATPNPKPESKRDHPAAAKRIERVETYAQLFYPAKPSYVHNTDAFVQMKDALPSTSAEAKIMAHRAQVEEIYQRHFGQR